MRAGKTETAKRMLHKRLMAMKPGEKLTVWVATMDGEGSYDATIIHRRGDWLTMDQAPPEGSTVIVSGETATGPRNRQERRALASRPKDDQ